MKGEPLANTRSRSSERARSSQSDPAPSSSAPTANDPEKGVSVSEKNTPPDNGHPKREDGTEYPRGPKLFVIILALCLAVFLMALE